MSADDRVSSSPILRVAFVLVIGAFASSPRSGFAGDDVRPDLEPVRLFVKSIGATGELRSLETADVVSRLHDVGLLGDAPDEIEATTRYVERLLAKLRFSKLGEFVNSPPAQTPVETPDGIFGFGDAGPFEVEPNDTIALAQSVPCDATICASIGVLGDVDVFVFTPGAFSEATIATTGDVGGDTVLTVFDASGRQLAQNDDVFGTATAYSTAIVPCLPAGSSVLVRVQLFSSASTLSHYLLRIDCRPTRSDYSEVEPNSTLGTRNDVGSFVLPGSHRVCGILEPGAADLDYFSFTLPLDSFVTITHGPNVGVTNAAVSIRLFDAAGQTLWFDADQFEAHGSQVALGLRAGTYVDRVRSKFANSPTQSWLAKIDVTPAVDVELEPNGVPASASPLLCNQTIRGLFAEDLSVGLGDLDYYSFSLPGTAAQAVSLFTGGPTATSMTLFAGDGVTVLGQNGGIGGGNPNSEIDATLAPGTYFVRLTGPNPNAGVGDPEFPYTLSLLCPAGVVEVEPNGSTATASLGLRCGVSPSGAVLGLGDVDYWTFALASDSDVSLSVGPGLNNVDVGLLAADGTTVLATGTNGAFASIRAGSYFARVTGRTTAGFTYALGVSCTPAVVPADVEPNDDRARAAPLACAETRIGLLSPRDRDVDYWSFTLTEWSRVTLAVDVPEPRSSVDPLLSIVDPSGNPIRTVDDVPGSSNASITINLSPGTWYAVVRSSAVANAHDPFPGKDLYAIHFLGCQPSPSELPTPLCTDDGLATVGRLGFAGSTGTWLIRTSEADTRVDLTASSRFIDPSLLLTDATGQYVDFDDDDGDGLDANVCVTLPSPGEYRFRVQDFGDGIGDYSLSLRFLSAARVTEVEPNDDAATAQRLQHATTVAGRLAAAADVDVYRFRVPGREPRGVTLVARSGAGHDNSPQAATNLAVRLLDATGGVLVVQDANEGPDADETLKVELGPGVYFVAVSAAGPLDPLAGEYDLTLRIGDVSVSLEPEPLVSCALVCDAPIPFRAVARNLRSSVPTTADYALLLRVGNGSPITLFEARNQTLGVAPAGRAGAGVRRTVRFWLSRAGVNVCASGATPVRFILVAREAGIEVARASFAFTLVN